MLIKNTWIIELFLICLHVHLRVSAQPMLKPLIEMPEYTHLHERQHTTNQRTESVQIEVKPNIIIGIKQGRNPDCNGSTEEMVLTAVGYNLGNNPSINWYKNGILIANGLEVNLTNTTNGDTIHARSTSTLTCATPINAVSNYIVIIKSDSLTPGVSLHIVAGSNPACSATEKITLEAIPMHGGANPFFTWIIDTTEVVGSNNSTITIDSLANNQQVYVLMQSDLTCATASQVSSLALRRSIVRSATPENTLKLLQITGENDCTQKLYLVESSVVRQGENPIYGWYKNGVMLYTTTSPVAQIPLSENGDYIQSLLISDLSCANPRTLFSNKIERIDTIKLPFFEDFSAYSRFPNRNKWIQNEGVFISGFYPVQPPTYHTAVFDGLRTQGSPYDTINTNSRGVTDRLTSLPIDLSIYDPVTNPVRISFYWQPQGKGEAPDSVSGDKFSLYFKNKNGTWTEMWKAGGQGLKPFVQENIRISNSEENLFYYTGFQFRFESRGRLTGNFDHWMLDYIYVGTGLPETGKVDFNDQSFEQPTNSILKGYTSIPTKHIISVSNPEDYVIDSNQIHLNNLSLEFNSLSLTKKTSDLFEQIQEQSEILLPTLRIEALENRKPIQIPIDKSFVSTLKADKDYIIQNMQIITGDADNLAPRFAPFTQNNTLIGYTILSNYYAYDDGSAEYALSTNQKFSSIAVNFTTLKKDTLKEIAISFVKTVRVLNNQSFNLKIFKKLPLVGANPADSDVLLDQNVLIRYANQTDGWTVYTLPTPIEIEDTFYIVLQQVSDDPVAIGWDRNNNYKNKIFYNIDGPWINYGRDTLNGEGALMIRPVFGAYSFVNKQAEKLSIKQSIHLPIIYPNPSEGKLCSVESLRDLRIRDTKGEVLYSKSLINHCIDLSHLPSGIYFLEGIFEGSCFKHKWIKQ